MKTIILILWLLSIFSQAFAQDYWQMVHPPTVGPGSLGVSGEGNVFVVWDYALKRSTNNGQTWDSIYTAFAGFSAFRTSPTGDIYLLSDSLRKSTDEGNSWITLSSPIAPYYYEYAIFKFNSNCDIFLRGSFGYERNFFYRSTNDGNSWEEIGIDSTTFFDITFKDNLTFATFSHYDGSSGVYKSYDNGTNWEMLTNAPTNLHSLLRTKTGDIYGGRHYGFGNPPKSLFKSTDDGVTWFSDSSYFTDQIQEIVENQFGHLFVATSNSVYRTTDNGNSWERMNLGLPSPHCFQIEVDPSGYVYVINSSFETLYRSVYSTIPVELVSFSAEVIDNKVQLNWHTASELNNRGFEIERKTNNSDWRIIGYREGNGTTTENNFYTFIDENISMGNYFYRLKQYDYDGSFEYSNIVEVEVDSPSDFSLDQNYPNPFNPTTKIKFSIPSVTLRRAQSDVFVTLKVYDVLGNEIAILVNEEKPAGSYEVEFNGGLIHQSAGGGIPSGVYFYQLRAGDPSSSSVQSFFETKKMVLMK